ncbi:hypothetical protein FORMB_07530 [Formosa sp. Hel1_33_131]|mgnify:CR=1 FL=1|jgi:hypothetical protein|uniref:hypothetical protein n=1 Tax=Formosa sp. Hel1_33_131 TaxID=1336794 RepID=UPI00084E1E95|nr:hypothetical protein [Formosa sp. Hel1_33_131]AOR27805.1 hypothetical protein FORMB_07530 [Formosa sp. Hel1_33_131]
MKNCPFFKNPLALIIVLGVCFSCIKDTDFDQATPITLTPIMDVNFMEFQETSSSFLDASGTEMPFISDLIVLEVLSSDFIHDHLTKAELVFEVTNSLNKAFQIKMDFYDPEDILQHSFSIDIDNSPSHIPLVTEHTEVFEAMSLQALKTSFKLEITITLVSNATGSVLTPDSEGNLDLISNGILYLEYTQ